MAATRIDVPDPLLTTAITSGIDLTIRIGIDTGPLIAGIIGRRNFSYDAWGATVNMASRMESHGAPGEIQVTQRVYEALRDRYEFHGRGRVELKGIRQA